MTKDISFNKAIKRLDEIVQKLENQDIDIEEATALLEEGLFLHKKCQEKLKNAQKKIDRLVNDEEVN